MNRKEYLKELENCLQSLSTEDRQDALRYYEDYFEDAGNDEKVMAELGTPEQLAESITSKIAGVLSVNKNANEKKYDVHHDEKNTIIGPFDVSSIKKLAMKTKAGEISIVKDDSFYISFDSDMDESAVQVYQKGDSLFIDCTKNFKKAFRLFSFEFNSRRSAELEIHIPENLYLQEFFADISFGELSSDSNLTLKSEHFELKAGAGDLTLSNIAGGNIHANCGMGDIHVTGKITGTSYVKCGMGDVKINVAGNPDDYSINANVGLGDINFNGEHKSGNCCFRTEKKQNNFAVDLGMGDVNISFNK